jgi:uncharacterized protein with PIN domain
MAKLPDCYPFHLHLSTAGDCKNRFRPLVKFQPVRLVNFRPVPTELATFEKMLQVLQFTIHEIDHGISYHARRLVRQFALSHSMEMGDALLAATAMAHNELLCTGNIKHFSQINGLVIDHYQPDEN